MTGGMRPALCWGPCRDGVPGLDLTARPGPDPGRAVPVSKCRSGGAAHDDKVQIDSSCDLAGPLVVPLGSLAPTWESARLASICKTCDPG